MVEIVNQADNILDLIMVGDLVDDTYDKIQYVNKSLLYLIKDRKENYDAKKLEDLGITQLYTKQGDNFVLVWDKERGVI